MKNLEKLKIKNIIEDVEYLEQKKQTDAIKKIAKEKKETLIKLLYENYLIELKK